MLDLHPIHRCLLVSRFARFRGIAAIACLIILAGSVDASMIVQSFDESPVGIEAASADYDRSNLSTVFALLGDRSHLDSSIYLLPGIDADFTRGSSMGGAGRSPQSNNRKDQAARPKTGHGDAPNPVLLDDSPTDSRLRFPSDLIFVESNSPSTNGGNATQAAGSPYSHHGEKLVIVGIVIPAEAFPAQAMLNWLRSRPFLHLLSAHPSELLRPPQIFATC